MKSLKTLIYESLWQDLIDTPDTELPSYTRNLYGKWNNIPIFNNDDIAKTVQELDKWFDKTNKELTDIKVQMHETDDCRRWPADYLLGVSAGIYGYKLEVFFDKRVVKKVLGIDGKTLYGLLTQNFDNVKDCYGGWTVEITPDNFEEIHNTITKIFNLQKTDVSKFLDSLKRLDKATKNAEKVFKKHNIPNLPSWEFQIKHKKGEI